MDSNILVHILDGREKPTNLPFALLKNITDNFSEDRVIGQGGFAIVYKGVLANGSVAVKRIRNNHTIDEKLFYRELDSLLTINHQNAVRFLGFCASTEHGAIKIEGSRLHQYYEIRERLLCFEYISNGNLQNHITDELRGLEWNTRYQIIKGICEGLHHLHKEKHIYHMDLKPANILLDNYMVPKITDFGLSRLDEKSQTMSQDRWGSRGYCAPEYQHSGKMSFRSDMFSLGVIITELIAGGKSIPDNNKNNVLRRWRHRWIKTGKESPLVYQQVAKCMEIGSLCQEIDPSKRPFIWEVIRDIREMEGINANMDSAYKYAFGQISPYSEDDMLGVEPLELHFPFELNKQIACSLKLTNHTDGYIAFNIRKMSPLPYCTKPEKDIVPPGASYSVDITLQAQDNVPRDRQRANEFTVWSTKVTDCLAPEGITTDMFSKESGVVDAVNLDVFFGAEKNTKEKDYLAAEDISTNMLNKEPCVVDEVNLDVVSDMDVLPQTETLEPNNIVGASDELEKSLQNSNAPPISLPLEFDVSLELTGAYGVVYKDKAPQDRLCANKFINGSEVNDGLAGEDVMMEMSTKGEDNAIDKLIPDSSMILDIHPLELWFFFEKYKIIPCSLDITNNTDEKMAFALKEKSSEETCFLRGWPTFGVVDPRTTYTLVLIMEKHLELPQQRNVDLILHTSTYCESSSDENTCIQHFQNAERLGITVHQVTLKCVCAPLRGVPIFEPIPPSIKIISMVDYSTFGRMIESVDANQTEPLIATAVYAGYVYIWNCDTQKYVGSIKIKEAHTAVRSFKFIARNGWLVVGTTDGFICVYNYKKEMQETTSFKAGDEVQSLAIHPTKSFVLSACTTGIKLWDWDGGWFGWKCMRTFQEHSGSVCAVAFNPKDHNSFASASRDCTIKVWSLDSPKSKYTLYGHSSCVYSLDFFTRDGQQYLITGSGDKTAKVWDMHKKECAGTLPHNSAVIYVLSHPTLPVLVTGTEHGHVHLWNSITFRLKRIVAIGSPSRIDGLACFNESGRVVVAHDMALSVIEIQDEEEQGGSSGPRHRLH